MFTPKKIVILKDINDEKPEQKYNYDWTIINVVINSIVCYKRISDNIKNRCLWCHP